MHAPDVSKLSVNSTFGLYIQYSKPGKLNGLLDNSFRIKIAARLRSHIFFLVLFIFDQFLLIDFAFDGKYAVFVFRSYAPQVTGNNEQIPAEMKPLEGCILCFKM